MVCSHWSLLLLLPMGSGAGGIEGRSGVLPTVLRPQTSLALTM